MSLLLLRLTKGVATICSQNKSSYCNRMVVTKKCIFQKWKNIYINKKTIVETGGLRKNSNYGTTCPCKGNHNNGSKNEILTKSKHSVDTVMMRCCIVLAEESWMTSNSTFWNHRLTNGKHKILQLCFMSAFVASTVYLTLTENLFRQEGE